MQPSAVENLASNANGSSHPDQDAKGGKSESSDPIAGNRPFAPELTAKLQRVGIEAPYECLLWLPRKWLDYSCVIDAKELHVHLGQTVVLSVTMAAKASKGAEKGQFTVPLETDCGQQFYATIFGNLFFSPWKNIAMGARIWIAGKPHLYQEQLQLRKVELVAQQDVGRIMPIYSGKSGVIAAEAVRMAIQEAMDTPYALDDAVVATRQAFGGMDEATITNKAGIGGSLRLLLQSLHRPASRGMIEWACEAARQLAIAHLRYCAQTATVRPLRVQSILRISEQALDQALAALPFAPTRGDRSQEYAIREIVRLLAEPYPMDAILTADVGVGKTLCYMVPAVLAQARGARVAVLIPNSILGAQIISEFQACFPKAPAKLVAEDTSDADIPWGENPVLIGTTKLFGLARKRQWKPNILIIDEQQKLSRDQRTRLAAEDTNVLECTATPLPNTIALLTYGGKDRIEVDKQHAVKTIHSHVVRQHHRALMFRRMDEMVRSGGRVAVIYARVDAGEESNRLSVMTAARQFEQRYPGQVVALHGRMTPEEKSSTMALAKSGQRRIIVSSSILEIGVTIPELRMMIVVNADRFGVSTLHQMRGRLVRNGGEGWFFAYIPDQDADQTEDGRGVAASTLARVALLTQSTNGFRLAELDMELRGFGDLIGDGTDRNSGKSRTLFRGLDLMPADVAGLLALK